MFELYVPLGDSISIDDYAGPGLGAASLLYRNQDAEWPEFRGQDLQTLNPGCQLIPLARDGAGVVQVKHSLSTLSAHPGPVLVSLTVGGNDILAGLDLQVFEHELARVLDRLQELYPQLTLLLGNVYDPSDGTGSMSWGADWSPLLAQLSDLNRRLFTAADRHGARPIDIHSHFLGHAPEWLYLDIEPTQRGSSEVRRLWWEALEPIGRVLRP